MAENNRTPEQNTTGGNQRNRSAGNAEQPAKSSSEQHLRDENSQSGDQWNNYRSRELSDQGGGAGNATTPKSDS